MENSSISLLWYTLQRNEFLFPVLVSLVLLAVLGKPLDWLCRRTWRLLAAVGRRRFLSLAIVFLLVIGIRLALLPWVAVPSPRIHDEFSHLLMADTFSHGRLTNPPSPMWVHFETFHVNMLPTYQSMYLPGQGMFLAFGQIVFHSPYAGVLLSVGLMCAAYLWAFRGWLPPAWAMLGALLTVLRYCSADYWVNSYWGGAVAATGGALVLGAYPRLWRKPQARDAILLAIGLLLLANTRPYEGLIYSIPFGIGVLVWLWQKGREPRIPWRSFLAPILLVLAVGFGAMMFYFWKSTGNPLKMPYTANQEQYHPTRPFIWQPLREVHYNHPWMQKLYTEWELGLYERTRTFSGAVDAGTERIRSHAGHFLRWLLLPFVVGGLYALWKPRLRIVVLAIVAMFLGMTLVLWKGDHHYAAPAAAALLMLSLAGLRVISTCLKKRNHIGLRFARAYVLVYFALLLWLQVTLIQAAAHHAYGWEEHRAKVVAEMEQRPGKHLILVRYGPGHDRAAEWVYNGYDLENGKVLWAREMADPAKNQELIHYYSSRQVWVIEPDHFKSEPVPYPAQAARNGPPKSPTQ